MYKWILIFCLPLASFAEVSLCSKSFANLTKTPAFLQTLRAVFARKNTTPEQIPAEVTVQRNLTIPPLANFKDASFDSSKVTVQESLTAQPLDPMLAERPRKPAGRPIFTKGLDEANRMIQLAERLRNSQIDPYTTHIPEFADDIPKHISFIKEGIEKSGEKKEAQLKALAELEKEALEKAKNKQVTYEWWLIWNENLINLASGFINQVTSLIDFFPEAILLPTISEVGITAMNRYFSQRVFPLGLVNQPTFVDGNLLRPAQFFDHDISHTNTALNYYYTPISDIDKHFNINLYQEFMNLDLTPEQQEMINLVYFTISHEQSFAIYLVKNWRGATNFEIPLSLRGNPIHRFQNKDDLRELLPVSVNADSREEVEAYLNKNKQLFEQLGHRILKAAARNK